MEAGVRGRGQHLRLGLGGLGRLLAGLPVLVGMIGKPADRRQPAELRGRAGDRAAGAGAEKHGDQRAGRQRIVLSHLHRLARAVAHRAARTGHVGA